MVILHKFLGKLIDAIGIVAVLLMLAMVANVFYDVLMRYLFNDVDIGMQELEWHLFAAMFMFGIGFTLKEDAHVRVDIFFEKMRPHTQATINIICAIVFALPITAIIMYYGYSYALDAFQMGEGSPDPGGLPHRWVIRAVIPASNLFLIICIFYHIVDNILRYKQPNIHQDHLHDEGV